MPKLTKTIINAADNTQIEVELTKIEIEELAAEFAKERADFYALKTAEEEKIAKRQLLLVKLGLTVEEAEAFLS